MKTLIALFALTFSGLVSANEDHLLMIPTPIQDSDAIYIVNRPMISGYGADSEGECGRISAPYLGEVRSPSSKVSEVDKNPASLAKITLSAVLPPKSDKFYKVTIDYSAATEDSKADVRLLRSISTCVCMFGDSVHGHLKLKVNFELSGLDPKSVLHAELSRFIDARKQQVDKFGQAGAGQPPARSECIRNTRTAAGVKPPASAARPITLDRNTICFT